MKNAVMKLVPCIPAFFVSLLSIQAQGPTPKREDVPKYLRMLKTAEKGADRALAAEMLGRRGAVNIKDVEPAIEPLQNALKNDKEAEVRRAAALALGMIAPEPANATVPLLIDALTDKVYSVRMAAVQALVAYGPDSIQALPALRMMQKEAKDKKDAKIIAAAIQSIAGKKK